MATQYSEQRANDIASPPVPNNANTAGRVLRKWFDLNTTARPINIGDTVELVKVPVKARLVGGRMDFEAMGASATLALGVSGTPAKYLAAASVAAIGSLPFMTTHALNFGEDVAAEFILLGTAAGANYAANKRLSGYIEYISAGE